MTHDLSVIAVFAHLFRKSIVAYCLSFSHSKIRALSDKKIDHVSLDERTYVFCRVKHHEDDDD